MEKVSPFFVIGRDKSAMVNFLAVGKTFHFSVERNERHNKIVNVLGVGRQIDSFVVDRLHRNGCEIHTIFSNGVIIVRNKRTNKIVTEMVARPNQISRYYSNLSCLPIEIMLAMSVAKKNVRFGYNYW